MTRNEAAQRVNKAFKSLKAIRAKPDAKKPAFESLTDLVKDASAKGFEVEIDGRVASYEFKHGAHAHENRKHEVAEFRLKLVAELAKDQPALRQKPVPVPTPAPAKATPAPEEPKA